MKRIALWAVLGLALAGCIVPSVYPFYTEKDLIFDAGLVGTWRDARPENDASKESWTFAKDGDTAYLLTMAKETETNVVGVHLFKLNDQQFMDWLLVPEDGSTAIAAHYVFKVDRLHPTMKLSTLNPDWLKDYLKKNPTAIRHTTGPDKPGSADEHIVLTADTKELQKFVLKHADDTNAFYDAMEMKPGETK